VLGAADVGANHQRDRIWIVGKMADTSRARRAKLHSDTRCSKERGCEIEWESSTKWKSPFVPNTNLPQQQRGGLSSGIHQENAYAGDSRWWEIEPDVGRVADGVAARVDRLKAIGNGQVPLCAATAWKLLTES